MFRALVTGGSRGIGRAIANELANRGIEVLTPGRQELDLADPSSVQRYVAAHQDDGIDILVNNAGVNVLASLDELTEPDWAAMTQINLSAPLMLIKGFAPGMRARSWGRILSTSSIFGIVTKEKRVMYSATKSGLQGLTRTAAVELGPFGILVNALCPGYVETELTLHNNSPADLERIVQTIPTQRLARPEEIARVAAFLCSDENTYLTGQAIVVDGGFTCK